VLTATLVSCWGCSHQQVGRESGKTSMGAKVGSPAEAINGDWLLLRRGSKLRVANGGALESQVDERRVRLFGYRLAGVHGKIVNLDAAAPDAEYTSRRYPPPAFARNAHFQFLSDNVGLLTRLEREPTLAFRPGPAPRHLLGRYALSGADGDIDTLTVEPRAVTLASAKRDRSEQLPILGASGPLGPGGILALLDGDGTSQLCIIVGPAGEILIELQSEHGVKGPFEARRISPPEATAPQPDPDGGASLPPPGRYVIEDVQGTRSGRLDIEGKHLSLTAGEGQASFPATLVGRVGGRASHVHLDLGQDLGLMHVDIWPLDDVERTFVIVGKRRAGKPGGSIYLMYPEGTHLDFAPSFGFDKDLDLLCSELAGLDTPAREETVTSALQRTGERASSLIMRLLAVSVAQVDPSMRLTMIRMVVESNGRSLPTCAGVQRLLPPRENGGSKREVTP
jgi:hypothetical protein